MHPRTVLLLAPLLLVACQVDGKDKPQGTNIGALRDDPPPTLPSDTQSIDMKQAVEEALRLGGATTLAAAWAGHAGTLANTPANCPQIWLGMPPESALDNVDFEMDDDNPGYSWAAACVVPTSNVDYEGFAHWTAVIAPGASGARTLVADATVLDGGGNPLFAFSGSASDQLDVVNGRYDSTLNGKLSGSLVGLGTGVQTGGDFVTSRGTDGTLNIQGAVTAFDGFGPPDNRDPDPKVSPELADVTNWKAGQPRFTSATFDLQFSPDCPQEPLGYIGLRGDEGFWFDVYFLPQYEDSGAPSAQHDAFPFEQIDNVTCDGTGTLFARNVDLKAWDDCDQSVIGTIGDDGKRHDVPCDASWSREVTPDFAGVVSGLSMPTLDSFIYNVREIPQE